MHPFAGLRGAGRQSFLQSLSQHARLLTIDTPFEPGALLVERFTGQESLSGLFHFDVDCLATSAHYELKALIGEEVSLRLLQADGSSRAFHGMVRQAEQRGGDGGIARYRLVLVPWLHSLTLRRDSYVFQDQSVLDIAEELFRDYPAASYRFDVRTALPKRSITMQYRESDYAFLTRLLAEEGLSFFFEHNGDAPATDGGDEEHRPGTARHRLVIFDDNAALAPCAQPLVRFHRAHATEADDTITRFAQGRQTQSNHVALASWDYKTLVATAAEDPMDEVPPSVPRLETYEGAGAYRFTDNEEGARIARTRSQSLGMAQHLIEGEGAVRQLAPGSWFTLAEHFEADGDYVVLSVEHHGANNLSSGLPEARTAGIERGSYRNRFTCIPRDVPIRPAYWLPKPTAPGVQVALVVGIGSEEITTERDHRVKIQFPWQRGEQPAAGQLRHPATPNAPGDERAGTWVRVAEPSAGANWGAAFIPRIGQEVCIRFIAGDIDRPVVVGQFYNGVDRPPFHGSGNHPGALTGIQTREYAGGGFNQWVIDDTPGQLRQSLSTTYAASQLHIGYLIRQNGNQRGVYRGSGFEAATDAWTTLRAKRGVFLTTSQRPGAASTQLDTEEAQSKLGSARELAQSLSDTAVQHRSHALSTPKGLEQLNQTLSGKDSSDNQQAPAFEQSIALLDSAAGLNFATPASSVLFAGQDLTVTAMTSMRLTAGQAATLAVAREAALFTHAGGAKVIAAREPVSVRAHTGPVDVIAQQAITVTSSKGHVKVQAKQEVLLTAGSGYVRLSGGNIDIHCPASISVKGVTHDFLGAGSGAADISPLPTGEIMLDPTETSLFEKYDEQIVYKDVQTEPIDGYLFYRVKNKPQVQVLQGQRPQQGETDRIGTPQPQALDYALLYKKITFKE